MNYPKKNLLAMLLVLPMIAAAEDPLGVSGSHPELNYVTSAEGIYEYRLPNGLQVLLFPNTSQALIKVNVTYRVGSLHEGYGETGMAHLLEHMLFKGTPNHPDIPRIFSEESISFNGTTWVDRTNYYGTFERSPRKLALLLKLEADRMVNSNISHEDLQSEFSVVRNEMEGGENNPGAMLDQRVRAAAYEWHNYGNSTIGARSDVEGVDIGRLRAFYETYYQPDNAALIISGDFDPVETAAVVVETFGAIPAPDRELPRIYTTEPVQDGERLVILRRAGEQGSVMATYHIPAGGTSENVALSLVAQVLSDFSRGRLYHRLVIPGIAVGASASTDSFAHPGLFALSATVPERGDGEPVLAALAEIAEGIAGDGITREEFEWAKKSMTNRYENTLNNVQGVTNILSDVVGAGDWRYLFLYKDQLDELTLSDVNRAAARYLIPSNRTAGIFVPTKQPRRAEIPPREDLTERLAALEGRKSVTEGEVFAATAENIDSRMIRHDLVGGGELWAIEKKRRGGDITLKIALSFGTEESLAGKNGIPGSAARQAYQESTRYSREDLTTEWERLNTDMGIGVGGQTMQISMTSDKEHFDEALVLMAHVVRNPSFSTRLLAERKRRSLSQLASARGEPGSAVGLVISKLLNRYEPSHFRYAMDLNEQEKMIRGLKRRDLVDFWDTFLGFEGAIATVVGEVDSAALADRLNELFGDWKAKIPYERLPNTHYGVAAQRGWLDTPDKANGVMAGILPIAMNVTDEDFPALFLASRIFGGGGMSNRLISRLRQEEGWSYSAGGSLGISVDPADDLASISVRAMAAPENLLDVRRGFFEEVQRVLDEGFTSREVEDAVNAEITEQLRSWTSDGTLLSLLGSTARHGMNAAWHVAMQEQFRRLTPEEVNAAFRKYYRPDDFIIFIGADKSKADG